MGTKSPEYVLIEDVYQFTSYGTELLIIKGTVAAVHDAIPSRSPSKVRIYTVNGLSFSVDQNLDEVLLRIEWHREWPEEESIKAADSEINRLEQQLRVLKELKSHE